MAISLERPGWPSLSNGTNVAVRVRGPSPLHPRTRRRPNRCATAALLTAAVFSSFACDRPPRADSLREWTPSDHHSSDDDRLAGRDQAAARGSQGAGGAGANGSTDGVDQLVEIAWRQQCTNCHGPSGRGDGQMGPLLHPPDFTSSDWQSRVTDGEMLATIKNGRNRMPGFDLPEPVLRGLVARVRSFRAR